MTELSRRRFLRHVALAGTGLWLAPGAVARAVTGAPGGPSALERWVPPENEPLKRLDEERWRLGLPHLLDTPA